MTLSDLGRRAAGPADGSERNLLTKNPPVNGTPSVAQTSREMSSSRRRGGHVRATGATSIGDIHRGRCAAPHPLCCWHFQLNWPVSARPDPNHCRSGFRRALGEPSNLFRIIAGRTQPDHLKRFFALFGTRSSVSKDRVPALAHETHFLVPNFSNFKILTKFDGFSTLTFAAMRSTVH